MACVAMNQEQLHAGLQAAFTAIDRDRDGRLRANELEVFLKNAGEEVKAETLEIIAGTDGGLTLDQFREAVEPNIGSKMVHDESELLVFKLCDPEGSGFVSLKGLCNGLTMLGLEANEEEAKELLKEFDEDKDGKLSREEFSQLMNSLS
eukprot:gnl/TRDRNA2_/TRDRNA2_181003_c0_seq1.p1 gnl/TRDRNA2_/TRDRNA2_181003_c0~~gnl/TRDRNA2_/TRDRNA2_181003_c0_seq1.p1  ORF type:complete len:175 (-),score=48.45 gnl/TRDRNA2_/TRDRNA2_181003_c0_seq1:53-499(-)